jgi:hypothetical protein
MVKRPQQNDETIEETLKFSLQHQYFTKRNDHNVLHSVLPDGFVFRFVHKRTDFKTILMGRA